MIYASRMYLHSTGILGSDQRYVVALLSVQPAAIGYAAGRANVTAAAGVLRAGLLAG